MKIVRLDEVEAVPFTKGEATRARVKYLIDGKDGSHRFFLRCYILEKGGQTPKDLHRHEHHVFILKGKGTLLSGGNKIEVKAGDVIYLAPYDPHQFINDGEEDLVFLCTRGAEELYQGEEQGMKLSGEVGEGAIC